VINEKLLEVLNNEGVVAIVTQGENEPHVVNTWNSYLKITEDGSIFGPVGGMRTTETNLQENNKVLVTLGSRDVQGFHSMGTGFLITGTAEIIAEGAEFDRIKQSFPWARATILIKPQSITQTL
jgi:predicted pyridoxine 5'-phosphate oxidase superfamily flavin-nucleotide-binding protein